MPYRIIQYSSNCIVPFSTVLAVSKRIVLEPYSPHRIGPHCIEPCCTVPYHRTINTTTYCTVAVLPYRFVRHHSYGSVRSFVLLRCPEISILRGRASGCKLSSFNNLPTSFPKSDQLCLKHVKNTYFLFIDW